MERKTDPGTDALLKERMKGRKKTKSSMQKVDPGTDAKLRALMKRMK